MRLIDADELREFLVRAGRFLKIQDDKRTAAHAVGKIIEHIDNMQTIDVEPVRHGHWNKNSDCSVCGMPAPTDNRYDFIDIAELKSCPYCGAKMDEEDNT